MTVMAIDKWATNAALIADVASLGYLSDDFLTLDPTYGEHGGFWKVWRPSRLITHDAKIDGVDFRDLPYPDDHFDAVVFDPPYKLNGKPDPNVDERYGVDESASIADRHRLIQLGVYETTRVLKPGGFLLVKSQDQVASGKVWWQSDLITNWALEMECHKIDSFMFMSYRPQPAGRSQVHARRNYSTLQVFRKS